MSNTVAAENQFSTMPRGAWRLVLLLMAVSFLAYFNRVAIQVAGEKRIMAEYGIDETALGFVYSAFLLTYTLFMIPGGWLIDKKGPHFSLGVVLWGSAIFVVLTGLVGLAISSATLALGTLIVVRLLMGMASAPLYPAAARTVSLGIPPLKRSLANGLITGCALIGIASTYVGFFLLIRIFEWPTAFIVCGLVTALLALLWSRQKPFQDREEATLKQSIQEQHFSTGSVSFLRRNRNLILLSLSYAAVGYFQYLFFYWIPYYFNEVLRLTDWRAQLAAMVPPLSMAVGMWTGGWLSDRLLSAFNWRVARAGMISVAMSTSAVLLFIGIRVVSDPFWVVALLSLALGVLGLVEGSFWVTAVEVGGKRGGLSAAIFNTGGNVGGIFAPIVTPWVSTTLNYGWGVGIGIGSAMCLLGAVLWFWIEEPDRLVTTGAPVTGPLANSFPLAATTTSPI